jgi:hypothetical protein
MIEKLIRKILCFGLAIIGLGLILAFVSVAEPLTGGLLHFLGLPASLKPPFVAFLNGSGFVIGASLIGGPLRLPPRSWGKMTAKGKKLAGIDELI